MLGLQSGWPRLVALFESRGVAYALLLILQLKVIWAIWAYREISIGDTAGYYTFAWHWFTAGEVNIAWSPAYTAFYGSFIFLSQDPVWATLAHRLVIVVAATLLVLAVLRQLLPPSIAWLGAAWWAVLPIVFNTMYEVHLFAALPVLAVWWLLLTAHGPWRRAAALALLGGAAVLVRNELSVPVALLAIFLSVWEWQAAANVPMGRWKVLRRTIVAYAVCLAATAALVATAYERAYIKYPQLSETIRLKHTLNMGQVYAYGYQQRHPEWTPSPWLDCAGLMQQLYGSPEPTLSEMIVANPRAVGDHVLWNFSLAPSGLQLLLFNRASGTVNPDYDTDTLRRLGSPLAGLLTALLLAIWGWGFVSLWRQKSYWWKEWLSPRILGWVGMLVVATVIPLVIATQRPRPSYLMTFGVLLIAITCLCFQVLVTRRGLLPRLRQMAPIAMVALLLFVPRFFTRASAALHPDLIGKASQRLAMHRAEIMRPGASLLVPSQPVGMYAHPTIRFVRGVDQYLRPLNQTTKPGEAPRGALYEFHWLINQLQPGETFASGLERFGIAFAYFDEQTLSILESLPDGVDAKEFLRGEDTLKWHLIDHGDRAGDRWRLYGFPE